MTDRVFIRDFLAHWKFDAYEISTDGGFCEVKRAWDGLQIIITAHFDPDRFSAPLERRDPHAEIMLVAPAMGAPAAWKFVDSDPARLVIVAPKEIYGRKARFRRDDIANDGYILFDKPFQLSTDLPVFAERAAVALRAQGLRW